MDVSLDQSDKRQFLTPLTLPMDANWNFGWRGKLRIIDLFIGPRAMAVLVMLWRDFIGPDATIPTAH